MIEKKQVLQPGARRKSIQVLEQDHSLQPEGALNAATLALLAERVSVLLQLDRTRHKVPTQVDMQALANVPAYLSSVFQKANMLEGELTPAEVYEVINRRVSDLQAQIYLLRLEMDSRLERDPAKLYEDPMVVSAYGERLSFIMQTPRDLSFEPQLIASGWHNSESSESRHWRWMRPGNSSIVCLPHLGKVDQLVEIWGEVIDPDQISSLRIFVQGTEAAIEVQPDPLHFVARIKLSLAQVQSANYLPIEFQMTDFRQPSPTDTRLLGAQVARFRCSALATSEPAGKPEYADTPQLIGTSEDTKMSERAAP